MAQLVARILGKDEVGGSSPLGSLEGTRMECPLFFCFSGHIFCGFGGNESQDVV